MPETAPSTNPATPAPVTEEIPVAPAPAPVEPADPVVQPEPVPDQTFKPEAGVQYGTAENPWPVPDMSGAAPGEVLTPPTPVP